MWSCGRVPVGARPSGDRHVPAQRRKESDSTELTGDVNYRKIAIYGSESDPRAFNFDGEFNVANRGLIEFVEVLKLDVAFLYDLLGASQEHKIKPKKFAQTDIDTVIIGHTNEPEYRSSAIERIHGGPARPDDQDRRAVLTTLSDEIAIYQKDYNGRKVRGRHIAPHTIEIAAMWAVMTRLEEPKNAGLTLLQKLKLYNGKTLRGSRWTTSSIARRGAVGGAARHLPPIRAGQGSNALVTDPSATSINPFMVLNELEGASSITRWFPTRRRASGNRQLVAVVKAEYTDIVKNEVQRAIAADEEALSRLCSNYIDNVKAYTQREKVRNKFTGQHEEPDERLIALHRDADRHPGNAQGRLPPRDHELHRRALAGWQIVQLPHERTAAESPRDEAVRGSKDTIKLSSLVSNVVDKDTQVKIDIVKGG